MLAALPLAVLAASGRGAAPGHAAATCGALSPLAAHRVRAGPLLFGFYTDPNAPAPTRAHSVFLSGYPTKVVVFRDRRRPLAHALTLRGFDCATGKSLRFWYRDGVPFASVPVSQAQLETTGVLAQVFPAARPALHGYMLFTAAGRWKINVWQGRRRLGAVVVQVG